MFEVLCETDDFVAIEKPSGVSVLRDRAGLPNLFDVIREQFPEAKLVHRLDKGTSGILIVARTKEFQAFASRQFAKRKVRKFYVAVVAGHIASGRSLTIDLPLNPGRKGRFRVAGLREEIRSRREGWFIDSSLGHPSTTRVRVLAIGPRRSLVLIQPLSGRTHQVRVHLAWIGHAIVGDTLYGAPRSNEQAWPRMLLHSSRICLADQCNLKSVPPDEFWQSVQS
ncbi:MAG: RNA pseudouridine synthase [Gammaproteobacteria bacterium]|nr:RNA pseudouridine synthase [Gammaproteobacteria bacterium]